MSDIAVSINDLWKRYQIGQRKSASFREQIGLWFQKKDEEKYFWALREIDFQIKHGEAVGIIGRNGAGKSTLLKLLSKITYPTRGRIEINGRVSSLLEVGTGFHPELTGRQNVFLNGTILGMTRSEIQSKFDEIVSFSGVEKFIDAPVKHYSSGMKVRLAFSVAAHLEPEVLIVDEVLAVGDAEFQKKCLGKMEDVTGEGRTVLFVSHNMSAIEILCNKGLVLKDGQALFAGNVSESINFYLGSMDKEGSAVIQQSDIKSKPIGFVGIKVMNQNKIETTSFLQGDSLIVEYTYAIYDQQLDLSGLHFSLNIYDQYSNALFCHQNLLIGKSYTDEQIRQSNKISFRLNEIILAKGSYFLDCDIVNRSTGYDWIKRFARINVDTRRIFNYVSPPINGLMSLEADWQLG